MKRTAMFRVWCKRTKTMQGPGGWFLIQQNGELFSHGPMRPLVAESLDHYDVMFYSGYDDKNGTRIFTGDQLQGNEGIYTIVHEKGAFRCLHRAHRKFYIARHTWKDKEIVGNIYENPET